MQPEGVATATKQSLADPENGFRTFLRDCFVNAIALLPSGLVEFLYEHMRRPLLWSLSHWEKAEFTLSPAGPRFCRFRMWLGWQSNTPYVIGCYELPVMEAIRRTVKRGYYCIDVGAHCGYLTIVLSMLVGKEGGVIAFEPTPENYELLEENIRLNGLTNVELEPLAVSEREGQIALVVPEERTPSWTPSATGYAVRGPQVTIHVAAVSLDAYLSVMPRRPALIKIDVEGAELAVLRGAQQTLRKARPLVLIELHDANSVENKEAIALLRDCGYGVREFGNRGGEVFCVASPIPTDGRPADQEQTGA